MSPIIRIYLISLLAVLLSSAAAPRQTAQEQNRQDSDISLDVEKIYSDSLSPIDVAKRLLDEEQYDSAAAILRGYLESDSANFEAWYLLGIAMDKTENLPAAVDCYHKSIALDSLYAGPCRSLAYLFDVFARYDSMNYYMHKAVELDEYPESLFYDFAYSFDMLAQIDSALVYYRRAIEANPLDNQAYLNMGAIWGTKENLDSARVYTQKSLEIDPDNPRGCYNYAAILSLEERLPEAIDYYQKSLALDPAMVAAKLRLGELYETLGDSSMAKIYFQDFIETAPIIYLDDIEKTKTRLKSYR